MVRLVPFIGLGLVLVICSIAFYLSDSGVNRGKTFGYWGDFNRTSNALAAIPGVNITRNWHNLDVTLEGFGFEVETNGMTVNLFFGKTDPIRNMPRDDAIILLQEMIHNEATRTNK